jgi:hypothetical protein
MNQGIDLMTRGVGVSFVALDGSADEAVRALHLRTPLEAQALAAVLRRKDGAS